MPGLVLCHAELLTIFGDSLLLMRGEADGNGQATGQVCGGFNGDGLAGGLLSTKWSDWTDPPERYEKEMFGEQNPSTS
ncbi:hypothetical protein SLEP1_g10955 [Rubroshorea leprosula]|uniref:Uncharacterized protein n=1 Tax=Rubroshorea leprosula TaxID=152421 RepID=A0AAV5II94_9ROSI|nr:hypothetical protein SLEP1_g10955 [Rubroshorea leprosula]